MVKFEALISFIFNLSDLADLTDEPK